MSPSGFVVIGAGLPRTGTLSLRTALMTLLDGKVYHMHDVFSGTIVDCEFWEKLIAGQEVSKQEWRDFLVKRGYKAGVDYPISLFYKELMDVFPDAKVILTVRNPETWFESVYNTIFRLNYLKRNFPFRVFAWLTGRSRFFKIPTGICDMPADGFEKGLFIAIGEGREASVDFFNEWTAHVKSTVPADRLLVFDVKQGWGPLCHFLGLPVPEQPFPNVNDTKTMQARFRFMRNASYGLVYGVPAVVAVIAGFIFRNNLTAFWKQQAF